MEFVFLLLKRNYSYMIPLESILHGGNTIDSLVGSFLIVLVCVKQRFAMLKHNYVLRDEREKNNSGKRHTLTEEKIS
jgi:hypothetical protein